MRRTWLQSISFTSAMGLLFSALPACNPAFAADPRLTPLVVPSAPVDEPALNFAGQPIGGTTFASPEPVPAAPTPQVAQPNGAAQEEVVKLSAEQLKTLVGPIALYPDALLAQVFAASTYPLEVVQAARFLKTNKDDPALLEKVDAQTWDASVKALSRYPSVLNMMDENLDWTQSLGAAFIAQQGDVMNTVQDLRAQAQAAGNLATNAQQKVVVQEKIIQIVPAEPEVIYVPQYVPEYVYVERYPVTFSVGYVWGGWFDLDCDWHHHRVCYNDRYDWHRHHHHHGGGHTLSYHNGRRYDNDRHDDHRDVDRKRDGDRNGRFVGSQWGHDNTKATPRLRQPTGNNINRVGSVVSAGSNIINGSGDRSDRTGRRDDNNGRTAVSPSIGNARTTPGAVRPVTPPMTPRSADVNPSQEKQGVGNGMLVPRRVDGSTRHDDGDRERRNTQPKVEDSPSFPAPSTRAAVKPTPIDPQDRAPARSTPVVTPRIAQPEKPADAPVIKSAPRAPSAAPPRIEAPAPAPVIRSAPVEKPVERSMPRAPSAAPKVESPAPVVRSAPAPRVEAPKPAPRIEAPAPAVRSAPPAPRVEAPKPSYRGEGSKETRGSKDTSNSGKRR